MKALMLLTLILGFVSCEQDKGSDLSKSSSGTSSVTIQSSAYSNDGSVVLSPTIQKLNNLLFMPSAFAATVSDFQFCITQMKVVTVGEAAAGSSQEAILGLIDVSDPSAITNWGTIELADGAQISEIHFEVHQDSENCSGANYSVSYNGQELTKDLEFKFEFDPAISIQNGDTLTLGLSTIAKAMEDASFAGQFTNENIGSYMENAQVGTGSKDD